MSSPILSTSEEYEGSEDDEKYERFVEVLRGVEMNNPFSNALSMMPTYINYLKDSIAQKTPIPDLIDEDHSIFMSH